MGEVTGISWTDHTFNPWIGCTKISPGCDNCYAEALARRYAWAEWGDHPRKRTSESNWEKPRQWNRKAQKTGARPFVFCASLADVFDNQVDPQWRLDLLRLVFETPYLRWLLLTKRPQNVMKMLREIEWAPCLPSNVAIGCTIVSQEEAERNVPALLEVDAVCRFVSCEPLLGPIDFRQIRDIRANNVLKPMEGWWLDACGRRYDATLTRHIHWVIAGGESGPNARPMNPAWARSLRDQCIATRTPFHFKQWGGPTPKAQGKELDGREWCERPAIPPIREAA